MALQRYADDGNKLLDRMVPLSKTRNDLIHGVVVSIEKVNGRFPIDKLDTQAQEHIVRRIEFDPSTFDTLTNELISLGKDLIVFGTSLAQRFRSL